MLIAQQKMEETFIYLVPHKEKKSTDISILGYLKLECVG